jgi:hypothetical protein
MEGGTIITALVPPLAERNIPKGGTGRYRAVEGSVWPNGLLARYVRLEPEFFNVFTIGGDTNMYQNVG